MPLRPLLLAATLLTGWVPGAAAVPVEGLILPIRQSEVCAPVASRILELKVGEGEVVKAGQTLALLDGKLEELEMRRAKVLLERREFEARSTQRLFDSKIIPEAKALESRIELELARLSTRPRPSRCACAPSWPPWMAWWWPTPGRWGSRSPWPSPSSASST